MELVNVQNSIVPDEAKVVETSDNRFILANTEPISYADLKNHCIIPVFSKDNESTISHSEFIDIVGQAADKFFTSEKILHPAIRISHPIKGEFQMRWVSLLNFLLKEKRPHIMNVWDSISRITLSTCRDTRF